MSQNFHKLVRRLKRADRGRKITVSLVPCDQPADARQDGVEIKQIGRTNDRRRRNREFEHRQSSSRRQDPVHLGARGLGVLHVTNAERDGHRVDRAVQNRHPRGVAPDERHPIGRVPASGSLSRPTLNIAPGKVDADDARRPGRRGSRRNRQIRRASAEIQHALVTDQRQRPNRRTAPAPIDARR